MKNLAHVTCDMKHVNSVTNVKVPNKLSSREIHDKRSVETQMYERSTRNQSLEIKYRAKINVLFGF